MDNGDREVEKIGRGSSLRPEIWLTRSISLPPSLFFPISSPPSASSGPFPPQNLRLSSRQRELCPCREPLELNHGNFDGKDDFRSRFLLLNQTITRNGKFPPFFSFFFSSSIFVPWCEWRFSWLNLDLNEKSLKNIHSVQFSLNIELLNDLKFFLNSSFNTKWIQKS